MLSRFVKHMLSHFVASSVKFKQGRLLLNPFIIVQLLNAPVIWMFHSRSLRGY